MQHFYRARLISLLTNNDDNAEDKGKLKVKVLRDLWDEFNKLDRTTTTDMTAQLVGDIHCLNKKLADWWDRKSKWTERPSGFRHVKVAVPKGRKVGDGIVSLHKKVAGRFGPFNQQPSTNYNIVIARKIWKALKDNGGERE
jgi:hypothetical protein